MKKKFRNKLQLDPKPSSRSRKELIKINLTENSIVEPQSKRSNTFLSYAQNFRPPTKGKMDDSLTKDKPNTSLRSLTQNSKNTKLPPIFSPIQKQPDKSTFSDIVSKINNPPKLTRKIKDFNYENEACLTISNNDFRHSLPMRKSTDEKDKEREDKTSNKRLSTETGKMNKEMLCFSPNQHLLYPNVNSRFMTRNKMNTKILIRAKSISSKSSDKSKSSIDEDDNKVYLHDKSHGVSQAGKNKTGNIKENQDSFLLAEKVLGLSDYHIYGVMDGHGTNGQYVSKYISSEALKYFSNEETYSISKDTPITSEMIKEKLEHKDYSLIKAFYKKMSQELPNAKFDVHFSGTTCVLVFLIDNKLICSNTGDSRAILIKDNNNTSSPQPFSLSSISSLPETKGSNDLFSNYTTMYLSIDHKPENAKEKERIESLGGVVDQYPEQGVKSGPYRVWVKGESYPGIAISRTLGDEIAESVGVIYNPDIITKDLDGHDKYFVLASDGVWEFLDNTMVMNIINPFYLQNNPEGACNAIISESTKWWEKEDVVIDDITVVVAFLRNNNKNSFELLP